MAVLFSNNATSTLSGGIIPSTTSLNLASGTGGLFPSVSAPDYYYVTLVDLSNNIEIVKVTGRTGDVLTVTRAQEGTTARTYATGSKVELRVTAAGLANKLDKDTGGTISGDIRLASGADLRIGSATGTTTSGGDSVLYNDANDLLFGISGTARAKLDSARFEVFGDIRLGSANPRLTFNTGGPELHAPAANTLAISTAGSERARVTPAGDFGVGTTAPNARLSLGQLVSNKVFSVYDDATNQYGMGIAPNDFRIYAASGATISFGTYARGSNTFTAHTQLGPSGAVTSANTSDAVGYKGLPVSSKTSSYTLALDDIGKMIDTNSNVTIPNNSTVAFPVGATIVIYNNSGSSITINSVNDILRKGGTIVSGPVTPTTLLNYGIATVVKVATTTWVISGAGVV